MLVLTRSPNEEIVIGDESIVIKVLNVVGQQVRLGITAPDNLSIHRREIYEKIISNKDNLPQESKERFITE